jgi:hypothetical protein
MSHRRATAQQRPARFEILCHRFEHCLRQSMCFEQMPEIQDRRLIRDRIASELQIAERAHRLDIIERDPGAEEAPSAVSTCAKSRARAPPADLPEIGLSERTGHQKKAPYGRRAFGSMRRLLVSSYAASAAFTLAVGLRQQGDWSRECSAS